MELTGDEPGMTVNLDHLHEFTVLGPARDPHSTLFKTPHVVVVHLVAMAVALMDHWPGVCIPGK